MVVSVYLRFEPAHTLSLCTTFTVTWGLWVEKKSFHIVFEVKTRVVGVH